MFKRRLAVLGAVGVLVLTGLGGSAMADEAPSTVPGVKVTCTTSDGKIITFAEPARAVGDPAAKPGEKAPKGGVALRLRDDQTIEIESLPEGAVTEAVPAKPAVKGEGFTAEGGEPADGAVKLGIARPAEDGSVPAETLATTVSVKCEPSK
ncbi:hypothetical protein [Nonomuraea aurantiaca]|jgi:hypothetical protein|uniref:hypothetical protein n=1 Tax=Nonomuraea aurantiaca TaxID=2878562 RepID=UPI001CD932A9|nr:hypothetical protein [Nonomuraea aurantiaca]MCA2229062.1 hypothetical protein [Nonomuraea aurantiaca]